MANVRPSVPGDREQWARMRVDLWPDDSPGEHALEIDRYYAGEFAGAPWMTLVAESGRGHLVGFVELALRPYAEGCRSSPVAYLEGWYVAPESRRQGVGRALIAAAEAWARTQGCSELASDTSPENEVSAEAHRSLDFEDEGLVRCFRKAL